MLKNSAKTTLLLFMFLPFFLCNFSAFAKAKPVKKTASKAIIIKGNERIDEETINSYLDVNALKKGSEKAVQDSLKKLYESDLFSESKIYRENGRFVVEVKENPIISDVKIVGNKKNNPLPIGNFVPGPIKS
jgi:outer membrane protein assembly factor BamA